MKILVFVFIILALLAQMGGAEGETASCGIGSGSDTDYTITPCNVANNEVFNMVVIGDSIAWGTGLNRDDKYSYLVAMWLAEQLGRPVNVKILAHTGATIEHQTNPDDPISYPIYNPELASATPTLMEQADMITDPNNIDFILVSGGANDVGLDNTLMLNSWRLNIIDWFTDDDVTSSYDDIRKAAENIEPSMFNLLNKLLTMCPNAKVVVTGYYTGISNNSKGITEVVTTIKPESQQLDEYKKLDEENKGQIVEKANLFYQISNESLSKATDVANANMLVARNIATNYDRAAFVPIFFPPERCYGTDNSWLWKIVEDPITKQKLSNDSMFEYRKTILMDFGWLCQCEPCISNLPINSESTSTQGNVDIEKLCEKYRRNKFVAIGHPNVDGAKNYSESIIREIRDIWPTWLYPTVVDFDASSLSLTSGESFEIVYTVSDNGGSGLRQVELWRTQEKDKWPKDPIQPPTVLAGRSGRISGSFTDSPPAPGTYWYGVHVVDNAGNWNDEKNSNTGGCPSSFDPMEVEVKKSCEVLASSLISNPSNTQRTWNKTFGKGVFYSIQQTSDSGYIATGYRYDEQGNQGVLLIKIDEAGNELFDKTFNMNTLDWGSSIQQISDGGYIIAGGTREEFEVNGWFGRGTSYTYRALLIMTDADGNWLWIKTFESHNGNPGLVYSVQPTIDGGYILAGHTFGEAWLIKTDSNGNEVWKRELTGSGPYYGGANCWAKSVLPTSDGGYILAGESPFTNDAILIKTDGDGKKVWDKTSDRPFGGHGFAGAFSIQPTNDNGYIIAGKTGGLMNLNSRGSDIHMSPDDTYSAYGSSDGYAWLIKTDIDGNMIWNKTYSIDYENHSAAYSVQQTSDGGYIIAGMTELGFPYYYVPWLAKTDSEGNMLWNRTFGGKYVGEAYSVQQTNDGGYIIAGTTAGNAWLIKTDSKGNTVPVSSP